MHFDNATKLSPFVFLLVSVFVFRSGTIPRCLEMSEVNEIENSLRNSADLEAEESAEASKSIGLGVSFGIGTILILMIIIGFLFLKVCVPSFIVFSFAFFYFSNLSILLA